MCGRFSLSTPSASIAEQFQAALFQEAAPRYNIAPTQPILGIRQEKQIGKRIATLYHWGLIPPWAKDIKIGNRLLNARSETLAEKPSFRAAYKYRRCVIPCDGFYEWKRVGGRKQPYFIQRADSRPLAFAGLWEHWSGPVGEEIQSATIVTTDANQFMAPIHDRMPVILNNDQLDPWLDPEIQDKNLLRDLMIPAGNDVLACYPVSTYVNYTANEGEQCIAPVPPQDDQATQQSLF